MKSICLYFQVHQPFRFKRYRFFNIGKDNYYYDDYTNEMILRKVADKCYLPANKIFLKLIKEYGCQFKIAFSISGVAIKQFKLYAPEVIESFKELAETGCVEFLAETYSHSLSSLADNDEFERQVNNHSQLIEETFGQKPKVFRNTELIYSDDIGQRVLKMGYNGILTEGAKHVLGWKSPNYLYCNALNPRLKVLLKNYSLSDDIAFRFSNKEWDGYPLTAKKYAAWLSEVGPKEEVINLFMDYETFGEHQWEETGIFKFLEEFPGEVFKTDKFKFSTPSEIIKELQPISAINVPHPISWADEERDLTAWLGNELQKEAFTKLSLLSDLVNQINDEKLQTDWQYLQISDHFYYMSTKIHSDGEVHSYFNPYDSPYDAFINYMNVLSDFEIRIKAALPKSDKDLEIASLVNVVVDQERKIQKYESEIQRLKKLKSYKSKNETATQKTTKKSLNKSTSKVVSQKDAKGKSTGTSKKKSTKRVSNKK